MMIPMPVTVDHVFLCTSAGAPAAVKLRQFGLVEGRPNRHPGQGTACRRFFFRNAMLELLWVEDAAEARERADPRLRLWDRWSAADNKVSPFGIILRPVAEPLLPCPFPSWEYRPKTMPDLVLDVALETSLSEPMWCYMKQGRAPAEVPAERRQPIDHSTGFREITRVTMVCPNLEELPVTKAMAEQKVIALRAGTEYLMELDFDGAPGGQTMDLRPDLPLVFRW